MGKIPERLLTPVRLVDRQCLQLVVTYASEKNEVGTGENLCHELYVAFLKQVYRPLRRHDHRGDQ